MEGGNSPHEKFDPFSPFTCPSLVKDDGITVGQKVQLKKYQKS